MRIFILFFLLASFMHAGNGTKGLRVYKKACQSCHGSGGYAAKQLNQAQWYDYFYFKAVKLKKVHKNEPEVINSLKALSKKKIQDLESFLVIQAKDSGYVNGCNGDSCGLSSGDVKISK